MEQIGQPITKMPSLGYQELDLHRLFAAVVTRGGMDEVTRRQEWKLVYQELEIPTMSTSASYNTRTNYKKYLYLYELEMCDWGEDRPMDAPGPKFQVGEYVRIVSSTYEGQVFYAQISKYRYRNSTNSYYVHYNGWSTSHDEWMPENVLNALHPSELAHPADLANPSPTRSSKSNYIIYDPLVSEKRIPVSVQLAVMGGSGLASAGQTTPKGKRKKSSPGKDQRYGAESDEYEYAEEDFIINSMAAAAHQQQQQQLLTQQQQLHQTSPANGANQRQSRRRPVANGKQLTSIGKSSGFFVEELDHPACDDQVHGWPKRRRDSMPCLDFTMGMPEQLYYFGGQWKHTTPRVRKFNLHGPTLEACTSLGLSLDPKMLREALKPHIFVMPELPILQPPKMPPVPRSLCIQPVDLDTRSIEEMQKDIKEKESRLRVMKKEYKHTTRLLQKYYGKQAVVRPSAASALLSSAFSLKMSRR